MDLAGLNFDDENAKRESLYSQRREVGIEGKALAQYSENEIKEAETIANDYEINIAKVLVELNDAESNNDKVIRLSNELGELANNIDNLEQDLNNKKEKFAQLKSEVDSSKIIPTEKLLETLTTAEQHNKKISEAKRIIENTEKVNAKRKEYESLTAEIENIDDAKKQILAYAKMPIEGLTIDDEGVLFNGIPFLQLSTSEKLKVSMSIAVAMNPKLKVIRILDGSLLDEDNLKVISEIAKDNDFQVWIECVSSDKSLGFYIEDGEVVN